MDGRLHDWRRDQGRSRRSWAGTIIGDGRWTTAETSWDSAITIAAAPKTAVRHEAIDSALSRPIKNMRNESIHSAAFAWLSRDPNR